MAAATSARDGRADCAGGAGGVDPGGGGGGIQVVTSAATLSPNRMRLGDAGPSPLTIRPIPKRGDTPATPINAKTIKIHVYSTCLLKT